MKRVFLFIPARCDHSDEWFWGLCYKKYIGKWHGDGSPMWRYYKKEEDMFLEGL